VANPEQLKIIGVEPISSIEVKEDDRLPRDHISERESKELVIALAGPIGSGTDAVRERLTLQLQGAGYTTHVIKISDYLKEAVKDSLVDIDDMEPRDSGFQRYIQMQDAGNELRKTQSDILAEYVVKNIAEIRTADIPEDTDIHDHTPNRDAFIIDQLKHPDEVRLLRTVYRNIFYLFGVLSSSSRRETRLKHQGIGADNLSYLMERDKSEKDGHGQQLDKALKLADFFLRNDHANADALDEQIIRFLKLIHGSNGISPTREEYGMYVAFAAGMRSACLSRVVGASIMDGEGRIISTGRNDVPKGMGGLYGPEDGRHDARCVKLEGAICFNSKYKNDLTDDIDTLIRKELTEFNHATGDQAHSKRIELFAKEIAKKIHNETRVGSLIEFSRSIHAEMDAIISLSRLGGGSTQDAILFTSTFPCHNCARHIVASGIKTVYYLEPYEKSLAKDLHWDSIGVDSEPQINETGRTKITFLHFEGVAPRQYLNIFNVDRERKNDDGTAIIGVINNSNKKIPEYLDDYRIYEAKVTEHYEGLIKKLKERK
jgi:deoxycytidylate deaminase